jgi:hypothetical protein
MMWLITNNLFCLSKVNLSVAIVAMVNHTAIPHINQTDVDICPEPAETPDSAVKVIRKTK